MNNYNYPDVSTVRLSWCLNYLICPCWFMCCGMACGICICPKKRTLPDSVLQIIPKVVQIGEFPTFGNTRLSGVQTLVEIDRYTVPTWDIWDCMHKIAQVVAAEFCRGFFLIIIIIYNYHQLSTYYGNHIIPSSTWLMFIIFHRPLTTVQALETVTLNSSKTELLLSRLGRKGPDWWHSFGTALMLFPFVCPPQ